MLQVIYLIAFTILAVLAIGNLIRSLVGFSMDAQRWEPSRRNGLSYPPGTVPHPELLDEMGNITNEPLLIVKSINVEDARAQLDAIYNDSPSVAEEEE
jgi:Protein of unknown function (DUF2973)